MIPKEPNAAAEFVDLFANKYERASLAKSGKVQDEQDRLITRMEKLQRLLAELAPHTETSQRVDWSQDPVKRALIDDIRNSNWKAAGMSGEANAADASAGDATDDLIPQGVYSWGGKNEEKVESFIKRINDHINHIVAPTMSQKAANLTQYQYEINEVMEIMVNLLKDINLLISRIQSNLQRS